jgi:hypothetical protein
MLVFLLQIADQEIGKMKNLKKENQMSVTIIAGTNGFKSGRMTRVFKGSGWQSRLQATTPHYFGLLIRFFYWLSSLNKTAQQTRRPPCLYHCGVMQQLKFSLHKALQKR